MSENATAREQLRRQRTQLLKHIHALLEIPATVLSFVWLVLIIVGFTAGLSHTLTLVSYIIWGIFVLQFLLEFVIAPHKGQYLRAHWLTAISLLLPAFGALRVLRAARFFLTARAAGYLNLVRVITSLNRGMRAVRRALGHRQVGYVVALSGIVLFVGAAGMYYFENPAALRQAGFTDPSQVGGGLTSYGDALWFTGMLLTTIGSTYFPNTTEGRLLCWLLALYALSVFGYLTAAIASLLVGEAKDDQRKKGTPRADAGAEIAGLREEVALLRAQLSTLNAALGDAPSRPAPPTDDVRPLS